MPPLSERCVQLHTVQHHSFQEACSHANHLSWAHSSVHIPRMAPCTHSLADVALWRVLPEAEGQTAPVAGLLVWPAQLACSVKRAVMLLGPSVLLCTPQLSCMHCNQDF